jgi:hypothetical protein
MEDDLKITLGRVEGKLDLVLEHQKAFETRIRSLEESRTKFIALAGGLGAVWGYVVKALTVVTLASYVAKGMPPELAQQIVFVSDYVTGLV